MPNLHHLELFYHVARAGGITAATRSMSYGIQQPAVSGQISSLETELGMRLFQRRPFRLTPAGEELFGFLAPFFGKLPMVVDSISGKASKRLRLSAPTLAIREHLPQIIADMRMKVPDLELSLFEASKERSFGLLDNEEVDLAVVEFEGKPPTNYQSRLLAKLALVLLLPPGMKVPRKGIKAIAGKMPLIRLPEQEPLARLFVKGLASHGLEWAPEIEVSGIDLITSYVEKGFGCGLGLEIRGVSLPPTISVMKLPGFSKLEIHGVWRGKAHPLAEEALAELGRIGTKLSAGGA
ncbi:MAG: LysR family transcriptional regulator [Luteolibacter sp.]